MSDEKYYEYVEATLKTMLSRLKKHRFQPGTMAMYRQLERMLEKTKELRKV